MLECNATAQKIGPIPLTSAPVPVTLHLSDIDVIFTIVEFVDKKGNKLDLVRSCCNGYPGY